MAYNFSHNLDIYYNQTGIYKTTSKISYQITIISDGTDLEEEFLLILVHHFQCQFVLLLSLQKIYTWVN